MIIQRNNLQIDIEDIKDLEPNDTIFCDTSEHMLVLCKKLTYSHIKFHQPLPLVIRILSV